MLNSKFRYWILFFLLVALFVGGTLASAQTTDFTYQGKLVDNSLPANASYDFEFRLFAVSTDGTPIGTRTRLNVPVTGGIFTVRLDFAAVGFNGTDRFLEIAVKPAGSPNPFITLLPRQPITYAPYAIRSLGAETADTATTATNATQLGGVAASQYVLTGDSRLSDARPPTAGSPNYIQKDPAIAQSGGFNIIGKGSAGTFDVITNYQIGGNRVLGVSGTNNFFAGVNAGIANTSGEDNAFFGRGAGFSNTQGSRNSFFGRAAGQTNLTGIGNAFFGFEAGRDNTADFNSFFGSGAGQSNGIGASNAFFGNGAGAANTGGSSNAFFGQQAGNSNLNGEDNSFFGRQAGFSNTGGNRNSFFGRDAGRNNVGSIGNAFFGFEAGRDNTAEANSFFGSQAGRSNTTGTRNAFFGNGAGDANTQGNDNVFFGKDAGGSNTSGSQNVFLGTSAGNSNTTGNNNTTIGQGADVFEDFGALSHATAIGAGAVAFASNSISIGRLDGSDQVFVNGALDVARALRLNTLAFAGSSTLCRNTSDQISSCSSSLRYKTNVRTFTGGLYIVGRLRPITFDWKDGGMSDVGFAAEEVQQIEPLLATYNKTGQIEGVKYGQLTTVLVNAIKEQQQQIEELKTMKLENAELKTQLTAVLARLERLERKQ